MKKLISILVLAVLFVSCSRQLATTGVQRPQEAVFFSVDYSVPGNNTFEVSVSFPPLTADNTIYQFASTAPGTYQVMDIGRFVRDFKVFDDKGRELDYRLLSVNQYFIENPERARAIQYKIDETWDTHVDSNSIYRMCGTSIEKDHVLLNPHCVLGYFKGMQDKPIELRINPREGWELGTALEKNAAGFFLADSYDHIVDSPILMGRLSKAGTVVNETTIEIYAYSRTDMIHAEQILESMQSLLINTDRFLEGLPVDNYCFLYHFDDANHGAWEHSYSSEYVSAEAEWELIADATVATASHEFFHIVTPLNIHSEVISQFNFSHPTPSQHLWLYEGVTEWASHMILLQGDQISLQEYLNRQKQKILIDEHYFDGSYSLTDIAETSFTATGHRQFGNIYCAGALTAGLLDIKMLQLSGGKRGLRELIVELAADYGPDKPFDEKGFFDEVVQRSHPEIEAFIEKYIKGTETLPYESYYNQLGINYKALYTDSSRSGLGFNYSISRQGITVVAKRPYEAISELQIGDKILSINGEAINRYAMADFLLEFEKLNPGTPYPIEVDRNGKQKTIQCKSVHFQDYYVFFPSDTATKDQLVLRRKWMGD